MGLQSDTVDNRMKTRACTIVEMESRRAIKAFGDRQAGLNSRSYQSQVGDFVEQDLFSDIVSSCFGTVAASASDIPHAAVIRPGRSGGAML